MRSAGSYIKKENSDEVELVDRTKQPDKSGARDSKGNLLDDKGEVKKADDAPEETPDDLDEQIDGIIEVIKLLEPDDPELWTGSGKPKVEAIEPILGRSITGGERDVAWDKYQEENH